MYAYAADDARVYQAGRDVNISFGNIRTCGNPARNGIRSRPIFIQYLNPEILACYSLRIVDRDNYRLLASAIRYTRIAVLATDSYVLMPASSVFEVPNIQLFLREADPLIRAGVLRYTASVPDLDTYRDSKVSEYERDSPNPYIVNATAFDRWRDSFIGEPRHVSTTAGDIESEWSTAFSPGGSLHVVEQSISRRWRGNATRLITILESVPQRLGGQAFIGRFARTIMPLEPTSAESLRINFFLSRAYLSSYLLDLDANLPVDLDEGDLSCGLPSHGNEFRSRLISIRALDLILKAAQIYDFVHEVAQWSELLELRETPELAFLSLFAFKGYDLYEIHRAAVKLNSSGFSAATSLPSTFSNVRRFVDAMLQ